MTTHTIKITMVLFIVTAMVSCSNYRYIPQTVHTQQQDEYYAEQDLPVVKTANSIEPYHNQQTSETNKKQTFVQKQVMKRLQKQTASSKQTELLTTITEKSVIEEGFKANYADTSNVKKQSVKAKDESFINSLPLICAMLGVISILVDFLNPIFGIFCSIFCIVFGLTGFVITITKHKHYLGIIFLGIILGIIALFIGAVLSLPPMGDGGSIMSHDM